MWERLMEVRSGKNKKWYNASGRLDNLFTINVDNNKYHRTLLTRLEMILGVQTAAQLHKTSHINVVYAAPCLGKSIFKKEEARDKRMWLDTDDIMKMIMGDKVFDKPWRHETTPNDSRIDEMLSLVRAFKWGEDQTVRLVTNLPTLAASRRIFCLFRSDYYSRVVDTYRDSRTSIESPDPNLCEKWYLDSVRFIKSDRCMNIGLFPGQWVSDVMNTDYDNFVQLRVQGVSIYVLPMRREF